MELNTDSLERTFSFSGCKDNSNIINYKPLNAFSPKKYPQSSQKTMNIDKIASKRNTQVGK
jgi:hypothetical protein